MFEVDGYLVEASILGEFSCVSQIYGIVVPVRFCFVHCVLAMLFLRLYGSTLRWAQPKGRSSLCIWPSRYPCIPMYSSLGCKAYYVKQAPIA